MGVLLLLLGFIVMPCDGRLWSGGMALWKEQLQRQHQRHEEALQKQEQQRLGVRHVHHFPTLNETLEMAELSRLMYVLRGNQNCTTSHDMIPPQYECLLYKDDNQKEGSQVLVVSSEDKIVVAFAGTDNVRTSLDDADIILKPLGPLDDKHKSILFPSAEGAKVHKGFDDSLFANGMYDSILQVLYNATAAPTNTLPLYITGHSLGAAESVLLGVAIMCENANTTNTTLSDTQQHPVGQRDRPVLLPTPRIINFGCPKLGNYNFHMALQETFPKLVSWRVVLGHDLVPRLPAYPFYHVGHTLQWSHKNVTDMTAYYQHRGNTTLGFAGVPLGWASFPFVWVPGAVSSHRMLVYLQHLQQLYNMTQATGRNEEFIVREFEGINNTPGGNDDDDLKVDDDDDGFWADDDVIHPKVE